MTPVTTEHPFPGLEALIPAHARLEHLAAGGTWTEGPVCQDDGSVLWSDIPGNRVLSWHPERGQAVFLHPAHFHNGHTRDASGALYACSHGERAVLKSTDQGQSWQAIATHHEGRRLNSPNDIIVAPDGAVWFTDPPDSRSVWSAEPPTARRTASSRWRWVSSSSTHPSWSSGCHARRIVSRGYSPWRSR